MEENKYGLLLNHDAKLQRKYFKEMCRLRGVRSMYQYPAKNMKDRTLYGEFDNEYSDPMEVWCIVNENVPQKTQRLLGWNAEVDTQATTITVPYDLEELQTGCRFTLPAGIDGAPDRLFRVEELSTIPIYPASVTCKVVLEYEDENDKSEIENFETSNFNLLREG